MNLTGLDLSDNPNLPSNWEFDRLGNRVTVRRGASPRPISDPRFIGGDIPWIKIGDVTNTGGRFVESTAECLTELGARHSVKVPVGSLIVANSGVSLGFATITKISGCIHDGWLLLTDFVECDPLFLYYRINSITNRLRGFADGTTQPNLNTDIARKLQFPFPPLREQRRIADILGSLDDMIELNRRTNETLEATARTLFRSWFVNFDPVRAKADGQKSQGVDDAIVKLFPDSFEMSRIGRVPSGWPVIPIGDHIEAVKGLSYKGEGLADAGMTLHNLNSVYEGGGYKYEGIKFYAGEYKDRHLVRPGDVIVTNTEQGHDLLLIGYPAIVPKFYGESGLFSHHLYRVRPREASPLTNHFIYFQLMDRRFRDEVTGHTNGTTVNMLAADGLQRPLFALPPPELIQAFDRFVAPLFQKAEQLHSESLDLKRTRDALLPKLLSGEVRVDPAEGVRHA